MYHPPSPSVYLFHLSVCLSRHTPPRLLVSTTPSHHENKLVTNFSKLTFEIAVQQKDATFKISKWQFRQTARERFWAFLVQVVGMSMLNVEMLGWIETEHSHTAMERELQHFDVKGRLGRWNVAPQRGPIYCIEEELVIVHQIYMPLFWTLDQYFLRVSKF